MPIYKAKQIDGEKVYEIVRAHPNKLFQIGMKEDWEFVHENLTSPKQDNVQGIDASWWDTPILKIFDGDGHYIAEFEVWKEIEFEQSEESYELHKKLLEDMKERRAQIISSK